MIKHLIKENEEQNLAWLAIVLPLASLCFWIPGVLVLVPLQFFLPELICGIMMLIFLIVWLAYVLTIWLRAIKIIRRAKVKRTSPVVFHVLQIISIIWAFCAIFLRNLEWHFLVQWLFIMDVALATFYLSYFLLAWTTFTRIPWHALTGFGIVFLSLAYESHHNPFHNSF